VSAEPRSFGPWELARELGSGGNATVYEATSEKYPDPVALKVINTTKANREPYRRFVREIEFLQKLEDKSGVLPVLDAHLPETPTKSERPWLAMPIARTLGEALPDAPLETVVAALAAIARSLARLAALGVAHRDIKPDNLYELDGQWLVGDFGLVALPEESNLTDANRPLGPTYYRPYEMTINPKDADPFAADVYAFGKTLWVLATGQNYPPQGHQPAATRRFSIADLRAHPRAALLDQLVDRATTLEPAGRPSTAEVAAELERWLALPPLPPALDLSTEAARLRQQLADELNAEDLLEQRKELALAAVHQLNELFKPLNGAVKSVHPRAQIDVVPDEYMRNVLSTYRSSGAPDIVFKHIRMSQISAGQQPIIFALRVARGIELTGDGELIVRVAIDVSYPRTSGTTYGWHSDELQAPVGSIESAAQLQQVAEETQMRLREAVTAFLDQLADDT
jgi:serine/threonine protein kinase